MEIKTIQKQHKRIYQNQNSNYQLGTEITKILGDTYSAFQEKKDQQQQIELNNKFQTVATQRQITLQDYKMKNSLNPNDKQSYETFQLTLNNINEQALGEVPTGYKNEFKRKLDELNINTNNDIELWKFNQNNKNNISQTENQIRTLNEQAIQYGIQGNLDDAINVFNVTAQTIKDNSMLMLGKEVSNQLTQNILSDYYTNYINGVLNSRPEEALTILEDENIKNIIGIENCDKLTIAGIERVKKFKEYNIQKEIAQLIVEEGFIAKQALNGNLTYADLNNFVNSKNINQNTRDYLMKVAGYKGGTGTSNKENLSIEDKYNAMNYIEKSLTILKAQGEEGNLDIVKKIQNTIFQYGNEGYLSFSDVKDYLDKIEEYSAPALKAKTFQEYNNSRFVTHDVGAQQILDFNEEILKNLNFYKENKKGKIIKEDGKPVLKEDKVKESSLIENFMYSNYRKNVDNELLQYAKTNIELLTTDVKDYKIINNDGSVNISKTLYRIKNDLAKNNIGELNKIYRKAVNKTFRQYAEYEGIDTTNKTPTEINKDIQNNLLFKINEHNNILLDKVSNSIYYKNNSLEQKLIND